MLDVGVVVYEAVKQIFADGRSLDFRLNGVDPPFSIEVGHIQNRLSLDCSEEEGDDRLHILGRDLLDIAENLD